MITVFQDEVTNEYTMGQNHRINETYLLNILLLYTWIDILYFTYTQVNSVVLGCFCEKCCVPV